MVVQPAAAAAGMEIYQGVHMMQHVFRYHGRDHLRRIAARIAGINLVQVGAAVLLGREPAKACRRHRVGNRHQYYPAAQLGSVQPVDELAKGHGREKFIAVRVGNDAERGPFFAAGDDVQRHA